MTVEDAIYIEAPPDVVWAVTLDVERWPKWIPTVTSIIRVDEGPFGLGSTARIKQPGQPESEWRVTEFIPGERFAWETRRLGLQMKASHAVESVSSGATSVLWVEVSGVMGVLLRPVLRGAVRRALAQENQGLKARCEELSGAAARR